MEKSEPSGWEHSRQDKQFIGRTYQMHFTNKSHEDNFQELLTRYPVALHDSQYQAACYIVAHPVIYDHRNRYSVASGHGPYAWYFDENGNQAKDVGRLSSGYLHLVKLGLELYNNHYHDDAADDFNLYLALGTWGDELFNVFMEACRIKLK
ncbi:DUF2538 family protein [Paenibacillus odorifer]|uniref:DUF2538 family protein n=1 Tax=Paenibacillus odorifer TaxID=189426 RepID=UPI0015C3F782|nr:DUF2538 family protein [Paenibacillus odorifer]